MSINGNCVICGDEVITKGQSHCYYCAEAYRAGIEAAAKWVEGQDTAPHFTAQLRMTIADGIRRAVHPRPSYVDQLKAEGSCGAEDHPIFKLPCILPAGHAGPHDNGSGVPWLSAPKEEAK